MLKTMGNEVEEVCRMKDGGRTCTRYEEVQVRIRMLGKSTSKLTSNIVPHSQTGVRSDLHAYLTWNQILRMPFLVSHHTRPSALNIIMQ